MTGKTPLLLIMLKIV